MQLPWHLSRQFWSRHIWGRGYSIATSGNLPDELISEYIKNQDIDKGNSEEFITVD